MTIKDLKKLIKYWQSGALEDLASANDISLKAKRYVQALFFVHLANEKILKSYYVYKFKDHAPFSHNLNHLVKKNELTLSSLQLKFLSEINEFNLECRYPEESKKLQKKVNANFVKKYIHFSEEFIHWISEKLEI
jgi:HEPN domain-containing protein